MIELKINSYMKFYISEPNELLELMSDDDKLQLIESLSCHDAVIKHVVAQIKHLYGSTENEHSGWSSGATGSTPLDNARNEIAESASELASDTIKDLKRVIGYKDSQIESLSNQLYGNY